MSFNLLKQFSFCRVVLLNSANQTALTIEAEYQTETYNTIRTLEDLITRFNGSSNILEKRNWGLRYEKNLRIDCLYESHLHSANLMLEEYVAMYACETEIIIHRLTTLDDVKAIFSTTEQHVRHTVNPHGMRFLKDSTALYEHLRIRDNLYLLRDNGKYIDLRL
jgi:hypothetical protein